MDHSDLIDTADKEDCHEVEETLQISRDANELTTSQEIFMNDSQVEEDEGDDETEDEEEKADEVVEEKQQQQQESSNECGNQSSFGEVKMADPTVPIDASSSLSASKPKHSSKELKNAKNILEENEKYNERMMLLLSNFSEEQHNQYEMYRRSRFNKSTIKRLVRQSTNEIIGDKVAIAIAGIAKVFVGDIIEHGLDFMEESKETGPLKPKHIREAMRRIKKSLPFL